MFKNIFRFFFWDLNFYFMSLMKMFVDFDNMIRLKMIILGIVYMFKFRLREVIVLYMY